MKRLATGLVCFGLACSAAAQDTSRDAELITSINKADMRYVIESAGYTVTGDLDSGIGVTGEDTAGLKFALSGKACRDDETCLGLDMILHIDDIGTDAYANKVNMKWAAIKAVALESQHLRLSRYLILDHGQTLQNLRLNLITLQEISAGVIADQTTTDSSSTATEIAWGDDSGDYANDDACDDARFHADGDNWSYQREHVLRDATDCRNLFAQGGLQLFLDFGDNSGDYTDDNECDDSRFTGEGRSILTTDSQVKRDSADCIAAYRAERLNRP